MKSMTNACKNASTGDKSAITVTAEMAMKCLCIHSIYDMYIFVYLYVCMHLYVYLQLYEMMCAHLFEWK